MSEINRKKSSGSKRKSPTLSAPEENTQNENEEPKTAEIKKKKTKKADEETVVSKSQVENEEPKMAAAIKKKKTKKMLRNQKKLQKKRRNRMIRSVRIVQVVGVLLLWIDVLIMMIGEMIIITENKDNHLVKQRIEMIGETMKEREEIGGQEIVMVEDLDNRRILRIGIREWTIRIGIREGSITVIKVLEETIIEEMIMTEVIGGLMIVVERGVEMVKEVEKEERKEIK
mmetsp:Transcript_16947/g.16299  ORF Transcript_16947/g.16299 Transcript_16947/m.16299 type:complete len:229 (+) Transcript_16947:58-744(+)